VLVLGDQLDERSAAFDGFDAEQDAVWMAEVRQEATYVWSHKARIALFLAAMRHFRNALRRRGFRVCYRQLDDAENRGSFAAELKATVQKMTPRRLIVVEPGEWRVKQALDATARELGIELEIRPDRHFLCSREHFAAHVQGREQLRMEFFYREMRRRHRVLMNSDEPEGGAWNFDSENREHFGKAGPGTISEPVPFRPDEVTREVLALVEERFTQHPGSLRHFDWPVT
jgi:deoxyribodipyrimidine photolyase-related protein